ncbi:MAG: hypothetical protein IJE08_06505, partial [Clostridia bacterium]|nr:hypothetical protein [Clostridia bacterium]
MKKFLLIALAALLVLTSMVVLADEATKTPVYEVINGATTAHFYYTGDTPVVNRGQSCTEGGLLTYKCQEKNCNHEIVAATTPALGHAWQDDNFEVITEATCTAPGEEKGYCTRCEAYATQPIPQLQHDPVINKVKDENGKDVDDVVPATCTTDGWTNATCSLCKQPMKINAVAKYNHVFPANYEDAQLAGKSALKVIQEGKAPTCSDKGELQWFTYCQLCYEKKPINENSEYYDPLQPVHQDHMDEWLFVDEDLDETPYSVAVAFVKDLGKDHLKEIKLTDKVQMPAIWYGPIEDTYGAYGSIAATNVEYVPATCTTPGYLKLTCSDEDCKATATLEIPAVGHSYRFYWGEDGNGKPTCLENGTVFVYCENEKNGVCSCDFVTEQAEIKAPGSHNWDEDEDNYTYSQDKTDMDDVVKGSIDDIAECHDYTVHVPCLGYEVEITFSNGKTVPLTIGCDEIDDITVEGNGEHIANDKLTAQQEENCYQGGYYHTYCTECGNYFGYETEPTGLHAKKYELVKKPTCTEDGEFAVTCSTPGCPFT